MEPYHDRDMNSLVSRYCESSQIKSCTGLVDSMRGGYQGGQVWSQDGKKDPVINLTLLRGLQMDWFFFGHHRCGTTWMRDIIRGLCNETKTNYYVIGGTDSNHKNNPDNKNKFICYVNAKPNHTLQIENPSKGFHLIRDPRDCLVSDYFSRKYSHSISHPRMATLRSELLDLPLEQGLLRMLEFQQSYGYINQIENWKIGSNKNILDIKYEELVSDEHGHIKRIISFLDMVIEEEIVERIINECSFTEITGRQPGQEERKDHRRKGVSGDWKNYFYEETPLKKDIYDVLEPIILNLGYTL
jgi:hypothetical protein